MSAQRAAKEVSCHAVDVHFLLNQN